MQSKLSRHLSWLRVSRLRMSRPVRLAVLAGIVIALAGMAVAWVVANHAPNTPAPTLGGPPCTDCAAVLSLPGVDGLPDAPSTAPMPRNGAAVQAPMPGCAEWTDRCITCRRDGGAITCSNIGFACQPEAVQCLRAEPAEEQK